VSRLIAWLVTATLLVGALALSLLVVGLPTASLSEQVAARMPESGVRSPVTAVLLNFRGYDTFLEMLVLLLVVLGVRSAAPLPAPAPQRPPGPVLEQMLKLTVPVLVIIAVYLLWLGAFAPGGAFQAGAVLAAAGVLMLLTERRPKAAISEPVLRLLLASGVGVFALVSLVLIVAGAGMLTYPPEYAAALILLIEVLATVAIGVTLIVLFAGVAKTED